VQTRTQSRIAQEAARIICEESITDYRLAKQKAAQRLGLGEKAAMPKNADIEAAVLEYQRLFGGAEYSDRLRRLRDTALKAMSLLDSFRPRLVGGVASGAISDAHRVQLHVFCEKPEILDAFFHDRGIAYEQGEREYRFSDGRIERVPLVRFEAGDIGVDVAAFAPEDEHRPPLSPTSGEAMRRITATEVEALPAAVVVGED
jgi:hypothetical protein